MSMHLHLKSSVHFPDLPCPSYIHLTHVHQHNLGRKRTRHASSRCRAIAADGLVEFPSLTDWQSPLPIQDGLAPVVALGKFDAMHIGHRSLAEAAAAMGGYPWLISFKGMAEVLNWEPKLPVLPLSERGFVLESWAPFCRGHIPRMRYLPFSEIRSMSPEDFVEILAYRLGAVGVVTGSNYRFGYKAAGNAKLLRQLGFVHNLRVQTLDLVATNKQALSETVSTSQVREALADGDLTRVSNYLERRHKLLVEMRAGQLRKAIFGGGVYCHEDAFLNQSPGPGDYNANIEVLASFLNGPWVSILDKPIETTVTVGSRGIEVPFFPLQEDDATRIRLKIEF